MSPDQPSFPSWASLMRVLVVDDHKLFAEAVQLALEKHGMDVVIATSPDEGLEAAVRTAPDVVLLDIGLPGRSGLELGREILEQQPDAKIVIVTSFEDQRALQEAVRLGFHGFLTKDTKLPQLVRAITDVGGRAVGRAPSARDPPTERGIG